jgi:hypothetical protein
MILKIAGFMFGAVLAGAVAFIAACIAMVRAIMDSDAVHDEWLNMNHPQPI